MLGPLKALLGGRTVVLASASPRRRQLLQDINFPVKVVPSQFEETLDKEAFPQPWR
jgi:septum formation protein